jgi:hypothetical protein
MRSFRSQRGSVMIVALIFAAILAIALTSYVKLSSGALRFANRSFYSNGAMNFVDLGLEQTLWSLNNTDWTRFSNPSAGVYQGTFPGATSTFALSGGVRGQVKVWVDTNNVVGTVVTPHAVAKATITLADGTTLVKMAEAYLQQRTFNSQPMVARTGISFTGNVFVDSWDSHSDTTTRADDVAYSTGVHHAEAGIASASVAVASESLQNADIYGRAYVGTRDNSGISVGSGGRLAGSFSAGTGIDFTRVTANFTASFPDIPPPTGNINSRGVINTATTLPDPVHDLTTVKDGKTYYIYSVPSISITGGNDLIISAGYNVILNVTQATGTSVQVGGSAGITITPTATLKMYTPGTVAIAGNGVLNGASGTPNNPVDFQLFGTRSAADAAINGMQQIDIKGNGYLAAVVNAPNANVFVNGNGDTYGAIFANRIELVGGGNFHADESLARIHDTGLWGLTKWRELSSSADRATYATQLSF